MVSLRITSILYILAYLIREFEDLLKFHAPFFITTLLNFDLDHIAGLRTTRIPVLLALTEIAAGIVYFYLMKQPRNKEGWAFYLKILIIGKSNFKLSL